MSEQPVEEEEEEEEEKAPSPKPIQGKKRKHTEDQRTDQEKMAKLAKTNPGLYKLLSRSNLVDTGDNIEDNDGISQDPEDIEMRRLEKRLGIKKGKGIKKEFGDDGLDCKCYIKNILAFIGGLYHHHF